MDASKYGKYFITDTPPDPGLPPNRGRDISIPWQNSLYISDDAEVLKGAFYLETNIVVQTGTAEIVARPHSHSFDEYLIFLGTDPNDQFDLGGEVEFWVGDEKHLITRTCAVFLPKGTPHCPLYFRRVDRPFMFITTGNTLGYGYS